MQSLNEPLTDRELELLAHLPGRAQNRDIAADMFLIMNTLSMTYGDRLGLK